MRKATALVMIAASLLLYAVALSTPAAADPGGNNGDVKIHETGTAVADQRNEPHVCTFYIDGFNFDGASTGTWHIETWAPTGSGTVLSGSWGPADAQGNWHSATISSLDPGHYKLFFKQTGTPGDDKHKVFWVECAPAAPVTGGTTGGTETGGTTTTTTTTTTTGIVIFTPNGTAVQGFQTAPNAVGAVTPTVEQPGAAQAAPSAVQGAQTAPVAGVQGLPSTSTESAPAIPLAALGLVMMGLGGALLRRTGSKA